jgi:glycosyltransferase involved in cell wall biosynthesis
VAKARLLDLTRLTSRLGRDVLTGIDRVEAAWLRHLVAGSDPVWGLVRSRAGFLLLDRDGMARFQDMVQDAAVPGRADLISRILWRRDARRARAETAVRRLAVARAVPWRLAAMLRLLGPNWQYLNLGHANLTDASLRQMRGQVVVLVHDTIPLDHPDWARPGTVEPFREKLRAVSRWAEVVVHSTNDARARTEAHLAALGRVPKGIVAPLGVDLAAPQALPAGVSLAHDYVVTVGTVEPRKNHALLLDVWDRAAAEGRALPHLYVVGGRGWASEALMERLGQTPGVTHLTGLNDGQVAALLQGARAMVFPSRAEGFGFPPLEAAARGIPVIASDLSVTRELLKDLPVYLNPDDLYSWLETIEALNTAPAAGQTATSVVQVADWGSHFKTLLTLT